MIAKLSDKHFSVNSADQSWISIAQAVGSTLPSPCGLPQVPILVDSEQFELWLNNWDYGSQQLKIMRLLHVPPPSRA
jgi:hypothetical protein